MPLVTGNAIWAYFHEQGWKNLFNLCTAFSTHTEKWHQMLRIGKKQVSIWETPEQETEIPRYLLTTKFVHLMCYMLMVGHLKPPVTYFWILMTESFSPLRKALDMKHLPEGILCLCMQYKVRLLHLNWGILYFPICCWSNHWHWRGIFTRSVISWPLSKNINPWSRSLNEHHWES